MTLKGLKWQKQQIKAVSDYGIMYHIGYREYTVS